MMFQSTAYNPVNFETGYGYLNYAVEGFWSNDTVHVRIERDRSWAREAGEVPTVTWKATVSWSSGGREADYDDVQAARNHAAAVLDAAEFAAGIDDKVEELEAAYQAYRAKVEEHRRAELEAEEAAKAADTPVSESRAKLILAYLKEFNGVFKMIPRGISDEKLAAIAGSLRGVWCRGYDKRVFYFGDQRYSKNDVLDLIMQSSNRGQLMTPAGEIVSI